MRQYNIQGNILFQSDVVRDNHKAVHDNTKWGSVSINPTRIDNIK